MRSRTAYPAASVPAGATKTFAHSNATRLLSAGTYLEKWYRKRVIDELVNNQFRVVAPSNGYDAVTVLAHALAARRLRRKQIACVVTGLVIDLALWQEGVIGQIGVVLLFYWLLWASAFLRRVATVQALTSWLSQNRDAADDAGDDFPANPALTARLAEKIAREQACATDRIFYGSYRPFVGAGLPLPDWSTAELLVPEKPNPLSEYVNRNTAYRQELSGPGLIPFTVGEITDYVADRLWADLRDELPYGEQIQNLTVERRKYCRAGTVPIRRRWLRPPVPQRPGTDDARAPRLVEDRERYDATREYLCVRIGAWDEELVVSIYVDFDLRGNTFYSEFFPYVLGPVIESFHLVDRLPESLTFGLLLRMAWDVPAGLPREVLRAVRGWRKRARTSAGAGENPAEPVPDADKSEFRLGRYAVDLVNCGAQTSVRELAASSEFHHFFQQTDSGKYIKIIERRLLQIIEDFLAAHHVDLGEHHARGMTILDASTHNHGNISVNGHAKINFGAGRDGRRSPSRSKSGS